MEENTYTTLAEKRRSPRKIRIGMLITVLLFIGIGYEVGIIYSPFPTGSEIRVQQGMNAQEIARLLKNENVIRSEYFFVWSVYIGGVHDRLSAGRFVFKEPMSMIDVIARLKGTQKEIVVVIPEGLNARQIGEILELFCLLRPTERAYRPKPT